MWLGDKRVAALIYSSVLAISNRLLPLKRRRQPLAGGYTRGATPVPIPNTAVKPAGPMILLQRESRSPPALNKRTPATPQSAGVLFLRSLIRESSSQFSPVPQAFSCGCL